MFGDPTSSKLNQELSAAMEMTSRHSATLVRRMETWAKETSTKLAALPEGQRVAAADVEFQHLWESLQEIAFRNPCSNCMLPFAQALEDTTHLLQIDPAWRTLHKGAHYYNMGLMYFAAKEVDRAFKFFLLADEEDATNKKTNPGDLFRKKKIFADLRDRFASPWLAKTSARFHDGLANTDERVELLATAVAAISDRYLLGRCLLGVLRANTTYLLTSAGVPIPLVEYLMGIEDLALLTEAAARMFHENVWLYTSTAMFREMLASSAPVALAGFERPSSVVQLTNQAGFRSELGKASNGDRKAMAGVVNVIRNQSAHATPYPAWFLDEVVLEQVQFIQLDFVTSLLADLQQRVAPPACVVFPPPAMATAVLGSAAPMSGSATP